MGNCTLSVIKKRCPKKRFPCARCGARLVNAGLQWEIVVPQYEKWYYMDPATLVVNSPASAGPVYLTAGELVENITDPETAAPAPCTWTGPENIQETRVLEGTTWEDYPGIAADFNPARFIGTVWEPDTPWVYFLRKHQALVSWEPAEEDEAELVTPGRWKISLTIHQAALYWSAVPYPDSFTNRAVGGSAEDWTTFSTAGLAGDYDPGEGYDPALGRYTPSIIKIDYYAPDPFPCPARGDYWRFTREIPTDPSGYQWHEVETANNPYIAPPYIDVRHEIK